VGYCETTPIGEILDSPLPSANGVFTARSLAKMYAAIAHGGEIEGVRLLSNAAALRMGRIQNRSFDRVIGIPMFWRRGYHMVPTTRGILRRAFGHFGYGGSGAFADPTRSLAAALVVNRVAGTPIGDFRMLELAAAAARAADNASTRQ
jgi:CubicO group peptidase (beta-lactamase class C family)